MSNGQPLAKAPRLNLPSLAALSLQTRGPGGQRVVVLKNRTPDPIADLPTPRLNPAQAIAPNNAIPADKTNMTKKDLMQNITRKVGAEQAISLVMAAYNTELITNKLSRLENKPGPDKLGSKKDHLELALRRVLDVVELTNP